MQRDHETVQIWSGFPEKKKRKKKERKFVHVGDDPLKNWLAKKIVEPWEWRPR